MRADRVVVFASKIMRISTSDDVLTFASAKPEVLRENQTLGSAPLLSRRSNGQSCMYCATVPWFLAPSSTFSSSSVYRTPSEACRVPSWFADVDAPWNGKPRGIWL